MKKYLTILACLVIFIVVFGCRQKPSAETETERAEPNAPAQIDTKAVEPKQVAKAAADGVAVTVNGVAITEKEVDADFKKMTAHMPATSVEQNKVEFRQQILDRIIAVRLIDEKSKATKITITDEDVRAQVAEIAAQQGVSVEEFKKMLLSRGMDYDEWEEQIRWGVKLGKLVEADFGDQLNITDTDANNFYSANIKQFETFEQVRASHILIRPDKADPNTDPNEAKAEALAKARDLLRQIKEEGADFAELAKVHSQSPSKEKGGDMGFQPRGAWVASFEKVAFELEVGQISDVVETPYGYHIIKVTDRKEAGVKPFEQARDEIIKMLKQRERMGFFGKYLMKLRAEAKVVYPPGKELPPVAPRP
ncbi:MAG: peptidylprolyl isomerase [Sedimentisphaerales bacterium]